MSGKLPPPPRLILINGPPGIGKSTLARRYAQDNALALVLDIDEIRTSMGQWKSHERSKLLARRLAIQMAREHLGNGHDVVVPQFLGRQEFVKTLSDVASECGASFHEVVILSPVDDALARLTARRKELDAAQTAHPLRLATYDSAALRKIINELRSIPDIRKSATLIESKAGDVEGVYEQMRHAIATPARHRLPA